MSEKRRQYTQEFKDSAVELVTEQGYQLSEAARSLGVNLSSVSYVAGKMRRELKKVVRQFRQKKIFMPCRLDPLGELGTLPALCLVYLEVSVLIIPKPDVRQSRR